MPTDLTNVGIRDREYYKFRGHPDIDKDRIAVRPEDDSGNLLTFSDVPLTTPTVYNFTAILADTEYSQALPSNTRRFLIRSRINCFLRVAFNSGETSTNYIEMGPGTSYKESGLDLTSSTIYFRSNVSNSIVEIVAWT